MHAEESRKLNTIEAAKRVGLGKSTLEKLRLTGYGPTYLKVGRRVVYDIRDLELLVDRTSSLFHELFLMSHVAGKYIDGPVSVIREALSGHELCATLRKLLQANS